MYASKLARGEGEEKKKEIKEGKQSRRNNPGTKKKEKDRGAEMGDQSRGGQKHSVSVQKTSS